MLKPLGDALATGLVCALCCRRRHSMALGPHAKSSAGEALVHCNEPPGRADRSSRRIVRVGGEPDSSPDGACGRSAAASVAGASPVDLGEDDLAVERIAIDRCREPIARIGHPDPADQLLAVILAVEEAYAGCSWVCRSRRDGSSRPGGFNPPSCSCAAHQPCG